jgi:selenoprotein W-related protein
MNPTIAIEYCPKCGWMLRAADMLQELLTTFTDDIKSVLLQPATMAGGYIIYVDEQVIFDRKTAGCFPETKALKQFISAIIAPGKDLGHSDKK